MNKIKCDNCHWFKDKNPFEVLSNGKFYPCSNIGVAGWDYWDEEQTEPPICPDFCEKGKYVPTGEWSTLAEIVRKVQEIVDDKQNK